MELFQDALDSGDIPFPDPVTGVLMCPKCGTPNTDLEGGEDYTEHGHYLSLKCPNCGWSTSSEV